MKTTQKKVFDRASWDNDAVYQHLQNLADDGWEVDEPIFEEFFVTAVITKEIQTQMRVEQTVEFDRESWDDKMIEKQLALLQRQGWILEKRVDSADTVSVEMYRIDTPDGTLVQEG